MTETPIYDAVLREHAGKWGRDFVRENLHACPTCKATPGTLCTTRNGNTAAASHKGRRWR